MGLCTAFVFSALVEFTVVNFWFRKFKKQKEHAMALMLPFVRTASNMTNVTNISGLTKNTMKVFLILGFPQTIKIWVLTNYKNIGFSKR